MLEQHHSGDGDNVGRDKIIYEIKALAPKDLTVPIGLVFESIRQKDKATAKAQMSVLRAIAQREDESAALVEVISIYGGLVEDQDRDAAWTTVAKIVSTATNPIIRDLCEAALLQLSYHTSREGDAKDLYLAEPSPGAYAREAYLRCYADEEQLREAGKGFPPEGVLTGAVEGALRLGSGDLAFELATRLNSHYGTYNARVLLAIATGYTLNPDFAEHHLWLSRPDVKERIDALRDIVIGLLEESGTDGRVHDLGCSIFQIYNGYQSGGLFKALKKQLQHLDSTRSDVIARFKVQAGDNAHLSQLDRDLQAASEDPNKRQAWCRQFLDTSPHSLEEVGPFLNLAKPGELEEWLNLPQILMGESEAEEAYIRLAANILQSSGQGDNPVHRREVSEQVERFAAEYEAVLPTIAPNGIFELAEKLFALNLPHKALKLTTPMMPSHELWPSPYVLTHLHCLLEAGQNKTFDEVLTRVKGANQSSALLSFQSVQAERSGDIDLAIKISESMIELAPTNAFAWYRRCYLLGRYRSLEEQQAFHPRVPDSVLVIPSHEVKGILFFLSLAGSFKRAESRWVEWMIEDPRSHAVDLVNFHLGLTTRKSEPMEVSPTVAHCRVAIQFTHERDSLIRLIVDDDLESSECTLKASSQLGQLLQRLSPGESENLNMATYKVEERLPPYVACLRIALTLRHVQNDGSDCFVMMQMPSDPDEFIPFLEEKMALDSQQREHLQKMDAIPLYMRGHALHPSNALKGAINCWTDQSVPKSPLCDIGEVEPTEIVLDAYGIGYLAVTNLAKYLMAIGVSFVVPAATQEALEQFLNEISDDGFMLLGVTEAGKLFRTTASDLRERDAHILETLRLILDNATVIRPVVHDVELEVFTIKEAVDATVYDAMQLSVANRIPWFCMDVTFGALHNLKSHPLVNVQAVLHRAIVRAPFEFEQRRHALVLYAVGALPLPLTFQDVYRLAMTPNTLAGFILLKIIQTHGREIFAAEGRPEILLNTIFLHLECFFGRDALAVNSKYSSGILYTSHVFNHGINLYLTLSGTASAEFRLAAAIHYFAQLSIRKQSLLKSLNARFVFFAKGHFMDWEAIRQNYLSIVEATQPQKLRADTDRDVSETPS
ncbi:PIN domain-containing protein [Pseudomonas chlororaphis]|uniref:GapS6b family protein n=1 Tax=Pseudomonas chlororaphis TaxID=587753 RepID=UPI0039E1325F